MGFVFDVVFEVEVVLLDGESDGSGGGKEEDEEEARRTTEYLW